MNTLIQLVPISLGLLTFIGGIVAWYSAAVVKRYAAQRDFNHLTRSYEQLVANQTTILKELDNRFDRLDRDIGDVRNQQTILLSRLMPSDTSGWQQRKPD